MRRSGFTIVEFIISISAMLIIMAAVFPIVFNKVQTSNLVHSDEMLSCNLASCSGGSKFIVNNKVKKDNCDEYNITIKKGTNEFVTVNLTGGGAGGGNNIRGGDGSSKVVYLPRVEGEYKIVVGKGGTQGQDGGYTAFYQCDDGNFDKCHLIASVAGGIASNQTETDDDETENDYAGAGGYGTNGKDGEVIISWN